MKKSSAVLFLSLSLLISIIMSCGSLMGDEGSRSSIIISGMVVDVNDDPLDNAIVRIINPQPEKVQTTDSTGTYSFVLQVDSSATYTIEARKEGLPAKSQEVLAVSDRDIELPHFKLADEENGQDDSSDSEGSAYISLDNVSSNEIRVDGTGGTETAELTFTVTDSAGNPVNDANSVYVNFDILEGPGGGESIYPDSVKTENGKATATLKSGTAAGVVQVQASFTRNGTSSPKSPGGSSSNVYSSTSSTVSHESKPVSVTISGGLPSEDHFDINVENANQVAANANQTNAISVQLGDKYGNDVPEGTSVYFSTDLGTITRSATTNAEGQATATLKTNSVTPGVATVAIETINENNETISKQAQVLFSGTPELSVTPKNVSLEGFSEQTFDYTLHDENGNPLVAGTSISVTVDHPDLEVSGDTDVTLDLGNRATDFNFTLENQSTDPIYENGTVTITTDGPNGSATETIDLSAPDAPAINPGHITLAEDGISNKQIGVINTGQTEQAQLTFQVTDSTGRSLDGDNKTEVQFSLGRTLGGGEDVYPKTIATDANGQATTTLTSGTEAGVVQVLAEITTVDGTTITTQPVQVAIHAGLPDPAHFTLLSEKGNVTANSAEKVQLTAYAGDIHGNIVPEGTTIYFTTEGGYITGSAETNAGGEATATLTAVNPTPGDGVSTVTAETIDDANNPVTATSDITFSGDPTISITPGTFTIADGGKEDFTYTVMDSNNHPMPPETTIEVSVVGGDFEVTDPDDGNITLGSNGQTDFAFTVADADPGNITNDTMYITVTVTLPNGDVFQERINGTKAKQ